MENLFERISNEHEMITKYIESYAGYGSSETELTSSLEYILRIWNENKQTLYRLFGNEVILSKQVKFNKPKEDMLEEMCDFLYSEQGGKFRFEFNCWTHNLDWNNPLHELMLTETLVDNVYLGEDFDIDLPNGKIYKLKHGCKPLRALGKIAKAFNLEGFEDFRIGHSMVLNQKKLEGELCLSIHPLDYMTMSDNECDWTSCMSWQGEGEYRLGTVEMMNSPCVVMAYLKSSRDMQWNPASWSNKKWRQLYVVNQDLIIGNRQYPYNNEDCNKIALDWLYELAVKNCGWNVYNNTPIEISNYAYNKVGEKDFHLCLETHYMYNDFSRGFLAYVSNNIKSEYYLNFSGPAECMSCGTTDLNFDDKSDSNRLCCYTCDHVVRCYECGDIIDASCSNEVDGVHLCSYCFKQYTYNCPICGDTHYPCGCNPSKTVRVSCEGKETYYDLHVCESCLNSDNFKKLFGKVDFQECGWDGYFIVYIENFTEKGLDYIEDLCEDDEDYAKFLAIIKTNQKVAS